MRAGWVAVTAFATATLIAGLLLARGCAAINTGRTPGERFAGNLPIPARRARGTVSWWPRRHPPTP